MFSKRLNTLRWLQTRIFDFLEFFFHYRLKGYEVIMLQTKFEEFLASSFEVTAKKIGCRAELQGSESEKLHGFMTFHFFCTKITHN